MKWGSGKAPDIAVNHSKPAIEMHKANHPDTHHDEASVWEIDPVRATAGRAVGSLWLSPDCRHFSKAKGGQPVSPKVRTLARVAIPWAKLPWDRRPKIIYLENVEEFEDWGPLMRVLDEATGKWEWLPNPAKKGEYFAKYIRDLKRQGYATEWRVLNSADYGAPTERHRFVLIARCDEESINWPKKTHGPGTRKPYRTMRECIEWDIPTRSIFGRKKPHAEATQRRLAAGLVRFVLEPHQKTQMDLLEPQDDLQLDFLTKFYGTSTGSTLDEPCPTVTAGGQHLGLVQAWIAKHYGGVVGHGLDRPLGTITTKDHHSLCDVATGSGDVERVISWLTKYYGTATYGSSIDKPCPTITTKARMGLAQAIVNVRTMQIVDVRMRMCTPRELARAMGFPDSFILTGTATEQVARIGNAVPPHLAAAVVAANTPNSQWRAAA